MIIHEILHTEKLDYKAIKNAIFDNQATCNSLDKWTLFCKRTNLFNIIYLGTLSFDVPFLHPQQRLGGQKDCNFFFCNLMTQYRVIAKYIYLKQLISKRIT